MTERLLARLGKQSLLRGAPCQVIVQHGVQFAGYGSESAAYRGDLVVDKSVATILKSLAPKAGDRLQHPDGDYDLDVLHRDNGHSVQFILRKHTA